jgi:hypothetical protein
MVQNECHRAPRDVQELARVLTGVGVNLNPADAQVRKGLQPYYMRQALFEFNPDASNPDTSGFDPNGNAPKCWAGGKLQGVSVGTKYVF